MRWISFSEIMAASTCTDIDQKKSIYQKSVLSQNLPSLSLKQLKINGINYYQSPSELLVHVNMHLLYHRIYHMLF